jgi:hypothetical protein
MLLSRRIPAVGQVTTMLRALSLIGLIWYAGASLAAELGVLARVMEGSVPLQRPAPDGRPVPVVTRVQSGDLYARLEKEATQGCTATMLALDDKAQRIAGTSTPKTMWLYLSTEEGGFARAGFWLREDGKERYLPDPFIDVVVDKGRIDDRGFEEIFAHEMGHIYLRRLLPTLRRVTRARRTEVHKSPRALREGLGPDLWLLAADTITINLNAADRRPAAAAWRRARRYGTSACKSPDCRTLHRCA